MEKWVRDQAVLRGSVYVVTGPIFDYPLDTLASGIIVPRSYYKVIMYKKGLKYHAIGFDIPQEYTSNKLSDYIVCVKYIEEITVIDFFPALNDRIENDVEWEVELEDWSF